ncbi:MAG: hypothetical protein P4L36_04905 [Holophaga sp.]|nr:hypothetical protein [Holophaga sp.]
MKRNFSRVFKGFLTGCLAFGSVVLQAEGYGLVLASDPHNQTVHFHASDGKTATSGDLALHKVLPLTPGGTYVFQFEEESDLEEECPFLEVGLMAVNESLDAELPFTFRVDLEGSGSPIRKIQSPSGHNKWLGYLADNGIRIFFKRGGEFHSLPRCESGEEMEMKERDGSMEAEHEVPVESKEAV